MALNGTHTMQTIELGRIGKAETLPDLVNAVIAESDRQVAGQGIKDPAGLEEFRIGCDALNLRRLAWRCAEEWGEPLDRKMVEQMKAMICHQRRYDGDEFESALHATRDRARLPFGWTAVDLAWHRARKNPIRLLPPELAEARTPTMIAAVARELQEIQEGEAILLPIEGLRELFGVRKIVVSGSISRLLEAGVLAYHDESYRTGKAREFRFCGKEGEHFQFVKRGDGRD